MVLSNALGRFGWLKALPYFIDVGVVVVDEARQVVAAVGCVVAQLKET